MAQTAPPSTAQPKQAALHTPATLRVGDVIRIQVWRQTEYSGEFEVSGAGTIAHPLYQEIRAAGRAVSDVELEVRRFLAGYVEHPSFVVQVFYRVPVGGEVRKPDVYALTPQTTVGRAIALAGGPTERGRQDRVVLLRDGQSLRLDLTDPHARLWEIEVRSGDQIMVERRRRDAFRDYIAPFASVIAAVGTVIRLTR